MKPESTSEKSPRLVHKLAIAGGVVVLGFGLAACGGSSDSSSTPSNSVADSQQPTGGNDLAAGKLPAGWPSDVPQPPNTEVVGGAATDKGFSAGFKGTGSLNSELDAYKKELESNGWTLDTTIDTGPNLTGWNKGNRRLQVIAQDNQDGTYHLNLTIVSK